MLKTILYDEHVALNANMAEFAGYQMPLYYTGVLEEHNRTRTHAGVFDVSHMGIIYVKGSGATKLLEFITPSQYSKMQRMAARYTVILNDGGGIIDDMIVTKINDSEYTLIVNASRKTTDFQYITTCAKKFTDVKTEQDTDKSIIAVQGQSAENILRTIFATDLSNINYMTALSLTYKNKNIIANRTGYTGEDGFELIIPNSVTKELWHAILDNPSATPVGLAARDSLRLEAGYPLYGSDLDETISPIEASLGWLITDANREFCGHTRILSEKTNGVTRKRYGVLLNEKGVLRAGFEVFDDQNHKIGYLSSGGYSPTLKKAIGLAYLDGEYTDVFIGMHNKAVPASIVKFPFVPTKTYKKKS